MAAEIVAIIVLGLGFLGVLVSIRQFIKECNDFTQVLKDAVEDDAVTDEEIRAIIKEAKDIPPAFMVIVKSFIGIFKK